MPNYANGKIYQIISPNYPLPYIGSTTQLLCQRIGEHRKINKHRCTSRIIIEAGDAYIELIENYPCDNKEQLNRREGEIIRERQCVNQKIPGRTILEYRQDNPELIKSYKQKYRETHREELRAKSKEYCKRNSEIISARKSARYYTLKNIKSEASESPAISETLPPS